MRINIEGLPKEKVLMELYNNAKTTMGFEITPDGMKLDHAKRLVNDSLCYEWLNGKALKIDLSSNVIDFSEYDFERKYEHAKFGLEKGKTAKEIIEKLKHENS